MDVDAHKHTHTQRQTQIHTHITRAQRASKRQAKQALLHPQNSIDSQKEKEPNSPVQKAGRVDDEDSEGEDEDKDSEEANNLDEDDEDQEEDETEQDIETEQKEEQEQEEEDEEDEEESVSVVKKAKKGGRKKAAAKENEKEKAKGKGKGKGKGKKGKAKFEKSDSGQNSAADGGGGDSTAALKKQLRQLKKEIKDLKTMHKNEIERINKRHRADIDKLVSVRNQSYQGANQRRASRSSRLAVTGFEVSWPLARMLADFEVLLLLIDHAKSKYCPEPVLFWKDVSRYEDEDRLPQAYEIAQSICKRFLYAGSEEELNVQSVERKKVTDIVELGPFEKEKPKHMFAALKEEACNLIKTNTYKTFVKYKPFLDYVDSMEDP